MTLYNLLTIIKSSYIQKRSFWVLKYSYKTVHSLKSANRLGLIHFSNTISGGSNLLTFLPLYINSLRVVSDIVFFPPMRYNFIIPVGLLRRLTYLTPSCIYLLQTHRGLETHIDSIKANSGGTIVALCV